MKYGLYFTENVISILAKMNKQIQLLFLKKSVQELYAYIVTLFKDQILHWI